MAHPPRLRRRCGIGIRFGFSQLENHNTWSTKCPSDPGRADMKALRMFVWMAVAWPIFSGAQTAPPASVPVRMVVTVGHYYGHQPPVLTRDDLTVTRQYEPLKITSVTPFRGDRAGLELFVLVDECSNCEMGSKFDQLRRFIGSQPAQTAVGVAYIQNGQLRIVQTPAFDRERAVRALSVPEGGKPGNPFRALTELIEKWPRGASRRAVLMISSGIDS